MKGWRLVVIACSAACSKEAPPPKTAGLTAPVAPARPLVEVTLGDCAEPSTTFISGPRPMPLAFTSEGIDRELAPSFGDGQIGDRLPRHAGRSAAPPAREQSQVSIGPAAITGQLDAGIVNRYIKRNLAKLHYCYDKGRTKKPDLAGTLTAKFTITGTKGLVKNASASGVDPAVASCFADVLGKIEYPLPVDKRDVTVEQPFALTAPPPPKKPFADLNGTAMHLDEGKMGRGDSKGTYTLPVGDRPGVYTPDGGSTPEEGLPRRYFPGGSSPLRGLSHELAACFNLQSAAWGVAVFDIGAGTQTASGIEHAGFKDCAARLAAKVRVTRPARCSAAFGRAAVHEVQGIDVTVANIVFDRQIIAPNDVAPRGEQRAQARSSATAPVLLDGPLVLRATPDAPMRLVNPVIDGLATAREDFVLAKLVDGAWTLLTEDVALPVVPVPRGTGGRWTFRGFPSDPDAEPSPRLSVLVVDATMTFVGTTFGDIRQLKTDMVELEKLLRELRASPSFADSTHIEIAADDAVVYATLVQLLELARKVGFIDASVHTPNSISVRFKS